MKITRKILENLIKEEISNLMSEPSSIIELLKEYKKARMREKTAFDEEGKQAANQRAEELRVEINNEINNLVPRVDLGHEEIMALSLKQNRATLEEVINLAQQFKELIETISPEDIENFGNELADDLAADAEDLKGLGDEFQRAYDKGYNEFPGK